MHPWVFVSPASRGIGFALTRHVLQTTRAPVVATARKDIERTKHKLLDGLSKVDESRLTVLPLDVLDETSISNAASQCKELFPPTKNTLHLSFIVPGILYPEKSPSQIDASSALLTFRTNTLGPMVMLKHFSPFLPTKRTASKDQKSNNHDNDASYPSPNPEFQGLPPTSVTAIMSARVGSISDNNLGGWYSYRASKAAVNQLVKTFDRYLYTRAGDAAVALALHPGTVRTGLSKEFWGSVKSDKLFEKEWVAERLVGVVKGDVVDGEVREEGKDGEWSSRRRGRVLDLRGKCWDWAGKEILP